MGMVSHFVAGFVFLPIFLIGAFVAMVCLSRPLYGEPITAVSVAALCILLNYLISKARAGMGKRLHEQGAWPLCSFSELLAES